MVGLTMRERMAEHRKNPECSSCHAKLDGIGLALENLDGIGKFRTQDGNVAIESDTVLPGGIKIQGSQGLRTYLVGQKDAFCRTLIEKLLTYGLGRGIRAEDRCFVDAILKQSKGSGFKMQTLVMGVVFSDPFLKKGSPEPVAKGAKGK